MKKTALKDQELIEHLLQYADVQEPPNYLADKIMERINKKTSFSLLSKVKQWFRQPFVVRLQPSMIAASVIICTLAFYGGIRYGDMTVPKADELTPEIDQSVDSLFLIGQGLIAGGEYNKALKYLNQASQIDPLRADVAYWQGVAYGMVGELEKERSSYRRSLSFKPDLYQANLNLGHSYLEHKELDAALKQYQLVLKKNEGNLQALYNQALVYREMGDVQLEKETYYQYLQWARTGKWARRAVLHLNRMGDFRYRVFTIGVSDVVIDTDSLLQSLGESTELEIDRILSYLPAGNTDLHLVVFNEGELDKAKQTGLKLRKQILEQKSGSQNVDVKISWFDVAEKLQGKADSEPVKLETSILIFTQNGSDNTIERKMI